MNLGDPIIAISIANFFLLLAIAYHTFLKKNNRSERKEPANENQSTIEDLKRNLNQKKIENDDLKRKLKFANEEIDERRQEISKIRNSYEGRIKDLQEIMSEKNKPEPLPSPDVSKPENHFFASFPSAHNIFLARDIILEPNMPHVFEFKGNTSGSFTVNPVGYSIPTILNSIKHYLEPVCDFDLDPSISYTSIKTASEGQFQIDNEGNIQIIKRAILTLQ